MRSRPRWNPAPNGRNLDDIDLSQALGAQARGLPWWLRLFVDEAVRDHDVTASKEPPLE